MANDHGNIILHQIKDDGKISIKEVKPILPSTPGLKALFLNEEKKLQWIDVFNDNGIIKISSPIITTIIQDDKLLGTNIYYKDGNLGIGRAPLHTYKFDIAVPINTQMTAVHIGDGKYGFSLGNGTSQGFIPEILGMGADENDAGLYFIGRAGNNLSSNIPLIVIDGRNCVDEPLTNRPILGVTNSKYNEYKFIIDQNGLVGIGKIPKTNMLEVNGKIQAQDFILDSSVSIISLIIDLKNKISNLEKQLIK